MHGKLMPWPVLVVLGASWLIALWLAVVPVQHQASLMRTLRLDSFVPGGLMLRVMGAAWVVLLVLMVWFNARPYIGR